MITFSLHKINRKEPLMSASMKCGLLDKLPVALYQAVIVLQQNGDVSVKINFKNEANFVEHWINNVTMVNEHASKDQQSEIVEVITAIPADIKAKVKKLKAEMAAKKLLDEIRATG